MTTAPFALTNPALVVPQVDFGQGPRIDLEALDQLAVQVTCTTATGEHAVTVLNHKDEEDGGIDLGYFLGTPDEDIVQLFFVNEESLTDEDADILGLDIDAGEAEALASALKDVHNAIIEQFRTHLDQAARTFTAHL